MPFSAADRDRLHATVRRLAAHVDGDALAITGGVALELALPDLRDRLADVDLVAGSPAAIRPSVTADFLVIHHHLPGAASPKLVLQLVDPDTRLRVDVFPDAVDARSSARPAPPLPFPVVAPAALLEHKLVTLSRAAPDRPVDPKHLTDALALCLTLRRALPARPAAGALAIDVYATDPELACPRCAGASFPLAPKRDILALLGYV